MLTTIFDREFLSGLVADFLLPLALVSVFAVAGTMPQLEAIVLLEKLLLPIVVALGFAVGEQCFPSSFKERHSLFLDSLPITRHRLWLAIISARLTASLAGVGLLVGALALVIRRASFVATEILAPLGTYSSVFMVFVVSYILGGISALLIRRTLFVYSFGLTLAEMTVFGLRVFSRAFVMNPAERPWSFDVEAFSRCWLTVLVFLLFVAIGISSYLFSHSDFSSERWRLRSFLALLLCLVVCATASLVCLLNPGLAPLFSDFEPFAYQFRSKIVQLPAGAAPDGIFEYFNTARLVSRDGKFIVVPEYLRSRPWFARISIVNTVTGLMTYRRSYQGLAQVRWSRQADLLTVVTIEGSSFDLEAERPVTISLAGMNSDGRILYKRLGGLELIDYGEIPTTLESRAFYGSRSVEEFSERRHQAENWRRYARDKEMETVRRYQAADSHLLFDNRKGRRIWTLGSDKVMASDGRVVHFIWPSR